MEEKEKEKRFNEIVEPDTDSRSSGHLSEDFDQTMFHLAVLEEMDAQKRILDAQFEDGFDETFAPGTHLRHGEPQSRSLDDAFDPEYLAQMYDQDLIDAEVHDQLNYTFKGAHPAYQKTSMRNTDINTDPVYRKMYGEICEEGVKEIIKNLQNSKIQTNRSQSDELVELEHPTKVVDQKNYDVDPKVCAALIELGLNPPKDDRRDSSQQSGDKVKQSPQADPQPNSSLSPKTKVK